MSATKQKTNKSAAKFGGNSPLGNKINVLKLTQTRKLICNYMILSTYNAHKLLSQLIFIGNPFLYTMKYLNRCPNI